MWRWTLFVLLVLGALDKGNGTAKKELEALTRRIGNALFNFSRTATKYSEVHSNFTRSESKIVPINLDDILANVMLKMNESLRKKVDAIEKVMLFAESKALDQNNRTPDGVTLMTPFHKSKNLNFSVVTLTQDEHFQTPVNTDFSSVQIPTSIYDEDTKVLEAVNWSSDLDASFRANYKENPTLSFQYFGSSTGFLRHYPAMKWPKGSDRESKMNQVKSKEAEQDDDNDDQDLYDCRTRPWYVAAANSPKNIVILQDVSGSMTGMRSQIAKRVIYTILDTLTENDYVNVYNFSNNSLPLVDCFQDRLVEANLENIREFKIALQQGLTEGFAITSKALESAYEMLENNFSDRSSSHCNQAIMIITDGSSEYYKEIFDRNNPSKKIRLFTFLIGREVTDYREVLWMACYNKGYYSHITTLGEVQEEVLKYLPVMSRPLVMSEKHHVAWTPVYADMAEIVESDWQWEEKTRERQKERSDRYKIFYRTFLAAKKDNKSLVAEFTTKRQMEEAKPDHLPLLLHSKVKNFLDHGSTDVDERHVRLMRAEKERNNLFTRHNWSPIDRQFRQFRFVVSASIPVFDKRKTNVSNDNERMANFLGVVGTDIPIKELQKLTSPFNLGVNGYAFAITNNGYVVFHPDWRPLFDDILRPNYNAVDLTEVELQHVLDEVPRNRHKEILDLRKAMIDNIYQNSTKRNITVKTHGDNFRRVKTRNLEYIHGKIDGTQYTLGLSIPMNSNQFIGAVEIFLRRKDKKVNATKFFDVPSNKHKWRLNPNWSYCEYLGSSDVKFNENKEVLLLYFLQRIQQSNHGWAWSATNATRPYICDKDLVQSLVFDAELTQGFATEENALRRSVLGNATVMSFIATRSGLTRWVDFDEPEAGTDIHFMKFHGRATEELWYKRAVDWSEIDENIFVFSVPFDAGTRASAQITATHAVFVKKEGRSAPVAVIGIQFDMDKFSDVLSFSPQTTKPKGRGGDSFTNICQGVEFDCFILDDNGFIIISENRDEIGQFFGEIDGRLMEVLLKAGIYDEIPVTDFQAVCLHPLIRNFGNVLITPFKHLKWIFNWFLGRVAWSVLKLNLHAFINPDYASVLADLAESEETSGGETVEGSMPFIKEASVPKTKLRPCDKKYKLYTYGAEYVKSNKTYHRSHDSCHQKCVDFMNAQRIPRTNLLLVVVQAKCRCGDQKFSLEGSEIEYPMHPSFVGKTDVNPVLLELCRIPYDPLYRKRLQSCYAYSPEEGEMKEDCGSDSSVLKSSFFWIVLLALLTSNLQ